VDKIAKTALASMSSLLIKRRVADNDSELMERRNSGQAIPKTDASMQQKLDVKKDEVNRSTLIRPANRKPTNILVEYASGSNSDMTSS
jgi:hypothetical protein